VCGRVGYELDGDDPAERRGDGSESLRRGPA
jgi:hypothetical protein